MNDETTDTTWPPCPDCGAEGDQRCADDCQRIAGHVGLTFNGRTSPVRRVQTEPTKAPRWFTEVCCG